MPRATVDQSPGDKVWLETCEGAFVVLKRMTYGQKQTRQQLAMRLSMSMEGNRQQRRRQGNMKTDIELLSLQSTMFDFKHCIVDHNLEDDAGRTLNLSSEEDVKQLDPRIGEEISSLIDDLNNFEKALDNGEGNS